MPASQIAYVPSLTHGIVLATLIATLTIIIAIPRSRFKWALMSGLEVIGWAAMPALPLAAIGFAADTLVFLRSVTEEQPIGLGVWGLGIGATIGVLLRGIRWYHTRRL